MDNDVEPTYHKTLENICKLKDLLPTSNSVNVYVRVLNVLVIAQRTYEDGATVKVGEILIGDNTAKIIMSARGEEQVQMLNTIDSIIRIENAKIEMFEGKYMRLTVDKWGSMTRCINITPEIKSLLSFEESDKDRELQKNESKIEPAERDTNMSLLEYVL